MRIVLTKQKPPSWSEASSAAQFLRRLLGCHQTIRGVPRILRFLRPVSFPPRKVLVDTVFGDPITIDPDDTSQLMLYYFPYCPELRALIADIVVDGDMCFDLGANVGIFSAVMAGAVGSQGQVIAVDPNPQVCCQLATTKTRRGMTNLQIVTAGISDSAGMGELVRPRKRFSESIEVIPAAYSGSVPLVTVDELAHQYGTPDFLKIDIEGAERHLISTMQELLGSQQRRPIVLVEYHRQKIIRRGGSVDEIRRQLCAVGYEEYFVKRADKGRYALIADPPSTIERENVLYATAENFQSRLAPRNLLSRAYEK
jgi:FkbM family methyltransferase